MKCRRELGLCYNCDERYHRQHVCKSLTPLLLLQDIPLSDSSNNDDPVVPTQEDKVTYKAFSVALHALVSDGTPNLIHLQGTIGSVALQVLLDSGATLNFIHPKWVPRLDLVLNIAKHFDVVVANGD